MIKAKYLHDESITQPGKPSYWYAVEDTETGERLTLLVANVEESYDDSGYCYRFTLLNPDLSPVSAEIADTYSDAIHDDLRQLFNQ